MSRIQVQPAVMTVRDFQTWSRLGRTRVYEEINLGRLRAFKIGRKNYIRLTDAEGWLAAYSGVAANCNEADA